VGHRRALRRSDQSLVTDMAQGRDLAKRLGGNNVALMRGHGFAAAARSLIDVVRLSSTCRATRACNSRRCRSAS